MDSITAMAARQCRLQEWTEQIKSCKNRPQVNITVQMYPCSEGTDTGSPALGYRESGTGIPHFVTCEFTRLLPDPSRILHAWICNSPGPSG